ncbi:phage baseplate assembly protein V [Pseudoxanthomonas sp. UTMC 1351]|uniref:phage baseplate assembly protein V n=1 Tax=Pseudoxanthomonas sp. UTMC 1351 TaxID=2695853 RepID=UPI0034CEC025
MMAKLRLLISRAIVRLVDDRAGVQTVQVSLLADEARAAVQRFQQYGLTSVPLAGAEAIAVAVGGSRSNLVVLAVDDRRFRKRDLQPGEVALYTDEGDYLLLKRGRIVEVKAGAKVRVDAPEAEFTGNLHVAGSITCDQHVSDAAGSMQEMRDTYNHHDHINVQPGSGKTPPPTQEMS